ncbi:hypothetical protein GCG54_00000105 [Colletotrichum gloeosporioides]|uniref:Uncharacterized protein n=1 Tax=Colletotrichum gloeosporioides TaxID=474922 RepID=A0A8H4CMR9_COLGL|nr:uncharacterized protein GCG54_00000105 [Colletotrichum gloeosporioides]KAF3806739.1 hypothetical protein GCG54_00000105 [Colletotrichum gloeosporioides]
MSCSASLGASSPTPSPPCAPPTQVPDQREYGDVFGPKRTNWKEAFLFFYWDMENCRCEEDMKTINAEIRRALCANYKSSNMAALPSSWDYVLHFLLRFLRRLTGNGFGSPSLTCLFADKLITGSNVSWNPDNEYEWINGPRTSNASVKPFVDWISLERLFANPEEVGRSILHHLETVAYGPLESRVCMTTDEAWYGNPYLVDFENAHKLEGPWRVPLRPEFVLEYDETDGIDDFFREFKKRVSGTTSIGFDFTFATNQGYAALVTDADVPINRRTVNWCKLFYTYLLHWALAMRNSSPGARLYLSLKSLLDNKEVVDDTMAHLIILSRCERR